MFLTEASHTSLLRNHSHATILLAYQIAHPTRHVALKAADEGRHGEW